MLAANWRNKVDYKKMQSRLIRLIGAVLSNGAVKTGVGTDLVQTWSAMMLTESRLPAETSMRVL